MARTMPRKRAPAATRCPACGGMIRYGSFMMMRFQYRDWVHARDACLYSDVTYVNGQPVQAQAPDDSSDSHS